MPAWMPSWLIVTLRVLLRLGIIALIGLVAVGGYFYYKACSYDLSKVATMEARTIVLDRNGHELAALGSTRRRLITRDEIPQDLVDALIAREDAKFFNHIGIDIRGLARATMRNVKDREFTQGASTLTMQLARNTYEMRAKSLKRKLLEIALTLRIEGHYEKDEILTHYLNRIYFGSGCHGVEEAAQTYFGMPAKQLNRGECALLAGIIRGPHIYSPFRNLDGALVQRDEVLARMQTTGMLSEQEVADAKALPIRLVERTRRQSPPSYAMQAIKRHLDVIIEDNDIRSGGLHIQTTIDADLSHQLVRDIADYWAKHYSSRPPQLAALIVDPRDGAVLALTGGTDHKRFPYNRALDARRELGNTFLPFLYLAALENNKLPIRRQPVQTGKQVGPGVVVKTAQQLGLKGPFNQRAHDLYRGSLSTTPLELATATSTLAANGKRPDTYFIDKLTLPSGSVIFQNTPAPTSIAEPGNAQEVLNMLRKEGKSARVFIGQSPQKSDIWALLLHKERIAVLWIGHDSQRPLTLSKSSQKSLTKLLRGWLPETPSVRSKLR